MAVEYFQHYPAEMAVMLAVILSPVLPLAHILLLRTRSGKPKPLLMMFMAFLLYGIIYFLAEFLLRA